jgi:2-polyprenyl-3-methyl-5-hydroxy-6-metoxy-1,4-benzoquinol methylase
LPAATALDSSCGSGTPIAQTRIALGFAVTGVDASGTMLKLFRSRLPAARRMSAQTAQAAAGS